jgi:predicted NACHT family NTPase
MLYVCKLHWHVSPLRGVRWLELWEPAAEKCTAYGAKSWTLTRNDEDTLAYEQTMIWESKADFERYWYSPEIAAARQAVVNWYDIPLLPEWHTLIAADSVAVTATGT